MFTSILLAVALNSTSARLPTCDTVVVQLRESAQKNGFQFMGAQHIPSGQVVLWQSKTQTLALILVARPPRDTNMFKYQGQCTGPAGIASIFTAVLPNQPPL